jgi:signal transduction histidine kinase
MNGLNLLLNNLLEWSTLQFTHSKIKLTDFNVYDVLENELKNQRKKILNKGNSLVNNIPRDFIVRSDINIVKFVFRNLINNSNKFTEKGEIRIDCEMDQNKYVFKVTDTGIGIEESRIPDLLNWEVRDSTPGSCGEMGSGLGLKIVNEMLEKLGGKLEIFSEVEKGSIFQFSIKIFK